MSLGSEYREYCKKFEAVWKYICSQSKRLDDIVSEICEMRLYFGEEERWGNLFKEIGVAFVSEDTCDYSKLKKGEFKDMALFSDKGHFLLNERYIIPVRDMLGNIIALIGWYPDSKKYITTPSKFFVRECLFFGMEQLNKTGLGKDYFVVEGIFDSLSLRSLGFNAVAMMGIAGSKVKNIEYGMFRKIVAIPDNDNQGRKVLKTDAWNIPQSGSYFRWTGKVDFGDGNEVGVKDIDKLCSLFDGEDLKELLNKCLKSNERYIKVSLD